MTSGNMSDMNSEDDNVYRKVLMMPPAKVQEISSRRNSKFKLKELLQSYIQCTADYVVKNRRKQFSTIILCPL